LAADHSLQARTSSISFGLAAVPEEGSTGASGCAATFDMTGSRRLICHRQTFGTHEARLLVFSAKREVTPEEFMLALRK